MSTGPATNPHGTPDMALDLLGRATRPSRLGDERRERAAETSIEPALECSVGIMAYNEEGNIANAIATILGQPSSFGRIAEVIVVASGCTDRTAEIVAEIAQRDPRVHLIEQQHREGKASAVNLFTGRARSPVLLMVSADVLVEKGTIDSLLRHFTDPTVGMVGGHPIPVNDETTFLGHAVHLLWRLHDQLARQSPKLGEIVAFRNVVPSIPRDTAVDEISIQALVTQLGYRLVYDPDAIVFNRGPATIGDFLRQRRRIYAGHLRVRRQQGYAASTMKVGRIVRALLRSGSFWTPRAAAWTLGTVALEALARVLGTYDALHGRSHSVWDAVATTKREILEGVDAGGQQNVLVFHIVNFNLYQLELGKRTSRQLADQVTQQIRDVFGVRNVVADQRSGTIIALMPGDRTEAELAAHPLVETFGRNGADRSRPQLACGIISFSHSTQPVARSLQAHSDAGIAVLLTSQET
jgi:glycosyltransferase involved in cell wall biosynthesis